LFTGELPADLQSVVLSISSRPELRRLVHALSINGARITDRAGNPLQGGATCVYSLNTAQIPRRPGRTSLPHGTRL
jgi:hypothetical protein